MPSGEERISWGLEDTVVCAVPLGPNAELDRTRSDRVGSGRARLTKSYMSSVYGVPSAVFKLGPPFLARYSYPLEAKAVYFIGSLLLLAPP
jgi:hypothetical protein